MKLNLRPSIFSNGLILVSVPLLFELAFATTLFYLQQDYEKKLQEQILANNVIMHANELWLSTIDLTTDVFATKVFPDRSLKNLDPRFGLTTIDDEYKILNKLMADQPQQLELLRRMRVITVAIIKQTMSFEDPSILDGFGSLRANLHDFKRVRKLISMLGDNIEQFREPWLKRTQEMSVAVAEQRKLIRNVTLGGVAMSVLMAGALFTYFIRNIYGSIQRLIDNAHRVAQQKPLLPEIGAGDELSQVDRTMHEMAKAVEAAMDEQKRLQDLKQDFFNMVTHDMRTPLSSVVLSVESLTHGLAGELPEEAVETLRRAETNASMLVNLINDLLDLEAAENQQLNVAPERFKTQPAFQEVLDLVQPLAQRSRVTVTLQCEGVGDMVADRYRFMRILTNLLANAIKFSPADSEVLVKAEQRDDCTFIDVIDHGRGIPEEQLPFVFEKFKQVEQGDRKKGSGLGLSIAKSFVENHGGKIGVDSRVGEGSRFWFWLPNGGNLSKSAARPFKAIGTDDDKASECAIM